MNLLLNKRGILLVLFFLLTKSAFSLSVNYTHPLQPFDSVFMQRAYSYAESETEVWNFGPYGSVQKTEIPDVYLQILGPTKTIYEQYGHIGIILDFPSIGSITFDYGVFDPRGENFVIDFIHGNLYYYLWYHRTGYKDEESEAKSQGYRYYLLNLTDEQKSKLVDFLLHNAREEKKWYLYDFFTDNCSTRARDVLNSVLDDKLRNETINISSGTFRTSIERAIRPYPLIEFVYNLVQGTLQDKPISLYDAMFLPECLELVIKDFKIKQNEKHIYNSETKKKISYYASNSLPQSCNLLSLNENGEKQNYVELNPPSLEEDNKVFEYTYYTHFANLVRENEYKSNYKKSVVKGSHLQPNYLLYLLVLLLIVGFNLAFGYFGKKKKFFLRFIGLLSFLIEFVFGVLSACMIYFSCFTIHDFLWYNYNLIFINPLLLVSSIISLVFAILPKDRSELFVSFHKVLSSLVLISLFLKVFYVQKNLYLILFFIFYYHSLIIAFPFHNKDNKFKDVYMFFKKFLKNPKSFLKNQNH